MFHTATRQNNPCKEKLQRTRRPPHPSPRDSAHPSSPRYTQVQMTPCSREKMRQLQLFSVFKLSGETAIYELLCSTSTKPKPARPLRIHGRVHTSRQNSHLTPTYSWQHVLVTCVARTAGGSRCALPLATFLCTRRFKGAFRLFIFV